MKIAFRIDCGSDIGMGHLTRMSALADVFLARGCHCAFFKSADEPVDYSGFDIIIIDTYQVDERYIAALNKPGRTVVCYDDNALYRYDCDVLINANLYAPELEFRFGAKTPRLLLGGGFTPLRREFRESEPIVVRKDAHRIFICFGGTDLRNTTAAVAEPLRDIPGVELIVVLGAQTKCDETVRALAAENVKVLKTPKSMADVMRRCHMAVTAAGSMTYELAVLGLPSLLIVQADNQKRIAEYMQRNGLMRCIGDWRSLDVNCLKTEVRALLADRDRRQLESVRLRHTVDKNGVENIADAILETVK